MSVIQGNAFSDDEVDTGDIGHSLRFRPASSTYASRTFGAGSNNKLALSVWGKNSDLSAATPMALLNGGDGSQVNANSDGIIIGATGKVLVFNRGGVTGSGGWAREFSGQHRDPTDFIHIFVLCDLTNGTVADKIQLWVNGVRETSYTDTGTIGASFQYLNTTTTANGHLIGRLNQGGGPTYGGGYKARYCFVDNPSGVTANSFGYLNTEINEWVTKSQSAVKAVVDAGGTNSTMLDFDDATSLTTLGYDKSSKGNNWTLNGFSLTAGTTYDHMLDVPGNSYATLNPIDSLTGSGGAVTLAESNLKATTPDNSEARSAAYVSSGKWYWEVTVATMNNSMIGVGVGGVVRHWATTGISYYGVNGNKYVNGTPTAYGATYTANDTIGVALNLDANEITFYKNGASQGTITGLTSGTYCPALSAAGASSVYNTAFGQAPLHASATYDSAAGGYFTYTPPTGFKALCQANLENTTVTVSGTFTGNAAADGPFVWCNGVPKTLTINGNAVTFGAHADKTAGGFKLRTSSASYNTAGSNTWTATIDSDLENCFKYRNAQGNP